MVSICRIDFGCGRNYLLNHWCNWRDNLCWLAIIPISSRRYNFGSRRYRSNRFVHKKIGGLIASRFLTKPHRSDRTESSDPGQGNCQPS